MPVTFDDLMLSFKGGGTYTGSRMLVTVWLSCIFWKMFLRPHRLTSN